MEPQSKEFDAFMTGYNTGAATGWARALGNYQ